MTPTVVSSVRPVALMVHLVHCHAFSRPIGGQHVGLLEQRRFGSLVAVALCLARRWRHFDSLGGGGASARSAAALRLARSAAVIRLARGWRSRLARWRRRFDLHGGGASARMVCGGVFAFATIANLAFRAWLWVLWDGHHGNGCSGPQSRLSESARAGSVAGISGSNPCR